MNYFSVNCIRNCKRWADDHVWVSPCEGVTLVYEFVEAAAKLWKQSSSRGLQAEQQFKTTLREYHESDCDKFYEQRSSTGDQSVPGDQSMHWREVARTGVNGDQEVIKSTNIQFGKSQKPKFRSRLLSRLNLTGIFLILVSISAISGENATSISITEFQDQEFQETCNSPESSLQSKASQDSGQYEPCDELPSASDHQSQVDGAGTSSELGDWQCKSQI